MICSCEPSPTPGGIIVVLVMPLVGVFFIDVLNAATIKFFTDRLV